MENKNYTDLNVWKESRALVKLIYEVTEPFPGREKFLLADQMRRA